MFTKNILSLYVVFFAIGLTGILGLYLTLIFNVKITNGAEWISYGLVLLPLLFTYLLIFVNENKKLKDNNESGGFIVTLNKIIRLVKNFITSGWLGLLILIEMVPLIILSFENKNYYWNGQLTNALKILHILIIVFLSFQMYLYNNYIYKTLFQHFEGVNYLSNKLIIQMVGMFVICFAAISLLWVHLTKFKTSDSELDKILK